MELTCETSEPSDTVVAPPAPQRSFAYFADLNPADNTKFIEARVYRKWIAVKMPSFIPTEFSCILLDKRGSAIQANTDLTEKDRFDHELQLNYDTFPHHYFNFAAYNELGSRLEKKNPILTDYIGYVHNVEKVKEYGSATGNKIKLRNIAIRNLNNNVVLFTLWNEKASAFEEEEYRKMRQPVILAVSSCYLKTYGGQIQLSATSTTSYYFNPPIDETAELLAAYNEANTQPLQIEVHTERSSEWEQKRNRNRVPLVTLLQIDPNTQQRVLFTQEVLILQLDTGYDWYYRKCDGCGGKLDYGFVHGHCHPYGNESKPQNSYSFRMTITDGTANATITCFSPQMDGLIKDVNALLEEVDNKDPAVLPPQILALQNTRHVFQFKFAKPSGKGTPTLVLQKVMDHPVPMLPTTAAEPSSPPAPLLPPGTSQQITPPPTTPSTTQETPANTSATPTQLTTSAVRKQLFIEAAEKEIDPQSKKQKTE
ncbi:nucleic acid-binding, OB-fold protein [Artemisia annua]|uniref:Nucleic acid-binding, OB-fold protein n=1 Tax=Artemisia annua TaxID=35608 RepID=A0A2U1NNH6_ARTAN|nr:nucleic acid-binding, OB-fold protein [Artemisia annua]